MAMRKTICSCMLPHCDARTKVTKDEKGCQLIQSHMQKKHAEALLGEQGRVLRVEKV